MGVMLIKTCHACYVHTVRFWAGNTTYENITRGHPPWTRCEITHFSWHKSPVDFKIVTEDRTKYAEDFQTTFNNRESLIELSE